MDVAKIIDHTNLKADATEGDITQTCQEAKKYGFRSVCINSKWVKLAKKLLEGTKIGVCAVIDWPCGASPTKVRVFQAKVAKKEGADEIDPVMNIGDFKAKRYGEVLRDLRALAKVLPAKVIIETGFLTKKEIARAAQLVKKSGAICVKTSTGMPPKVDIAAKVRHVIIMRKVVGSKFLIKAAGGIRDRGDIEKMVRAGANIIGTSAGVEIVKS